MSWRRSFAALAAEDDREGNNLPIAVLEIR
jgi:hypothetical protein